LRRGCCKTTRRDQRALKGKKPHERSSAGPVDGLLSKGSSASVGWTGDDGSSRGTEEQWSRDTAPKCTPEPNDAADSTIWKDVARDLAKKFTRPNPIGPRTFASQFHPATAKRGRAVDAPGNGCNNARYRAQSSEEAKQTFETSFEEGQCS
jgi:hypothetical protein